MHPRFKQLILINAACLLFLGVTICAYAAPQALSAEELATLADKAESKEDHTKLAQHYATKAEEFEKSAARHEAMGKRYEQRTTAPKGRVSKAAMATHCKNLARSLRTAAKETRQLAAAHDAMANEASK